MSGSAGADERQGGAWHAHLRAPFASSPRRVRCSVRSVRSAGPCGFTSHMHGMYAVPRHGSVCGGSSARRAGQIHVHATHSPRAVSRPGARCVEVLTPLAVHTMFRFRTAWRFACAASAFVVWPDACSFALAGLVLPPPCWSRGMLRVCVAWKRESFPCAVCWLPSPPLFPSRLSAPQLPVSSPRVP